MFLEAGLLTRRSVRQYIKCKKISREDMEDLLKIAMYAPSGYNMNR
jgi:nitroreductase